MQGPFFSFAVFWRQVFEMVLDQVCQLLRRLIKPPVLLIHVTTSLAYSIKGVHDSRPRTFSLSASPSTRLPASFA